MAKKVTVEIEQLVEHLIIRMKDIFLTKKEFEEKLEEEIGHLPTKEEFYGQTDKVMKELQDMREEHTISIGQVSDHSDRIEKLEEKVLRI